MTKWAKKYELLKKDLLETREVIVLYEGLMAKLTEQNAKLKDWIKTKKRTERSQLRKLAKAKNSGVLAQTFLE